MKASELREKSVEELNNELANLKDELFRLRFQLAINQLDNPMRIKAVKKDIARIMTIDRKSTRLNSSHKVQSRMPSSA